MKKWDVVLLGFPFVDLTGAKVRPAVVVSPDSHNASLEAGVFVQITSNIERSTPFDILIESSHPEFRRTGLKKDSMLRVSKIWTLEQTLVKTKIGLLGPLLQRQLDEQLQAFFEIQPFLPQAR